MRKGAKLAAFIAAIPVLLIGTTGVGNAAAHEEAKTECYVLLDKAPTPGAESPVLERKCAEPGEKINVPAASTLLVVLYQDVNYGGDSTQLRGWSGPCDASGYGFRNLGSWSDRVTSYKVFNSCTYSSVFEHENYGGICDEFRGNVPWVGTGVNDKITSMWVSKEASGAWSHCD